MKNSLAVSVLINFIYILNAYYDKFFLFLVDLCTLLLKNFKTFKHKSHTHHTICTCKLIIITKSIARVYLTFYVYFNTKSRALEYIILLIGQIVIAGKSILARG